MLLLEGFLARDPHQLAVRDAAGDHDWGAVLAQARRVAGTLAAVGPPGMAVGLMVEPGVRWLASLLGIWHAGGVAVPLSPLHPPREIAWLLEDAEAACLLTDHDVAPSGVPHLDPRACEGPEADTPRGHSLAMLLYTSGTTGRPKGVELEHAALTHQADELGEVWRLGELRNLLHALPLHHMHGIAIAGLPCLRAGMALTMHPRFRAPTIWEGLAEVDTFMGVPTMYHRLLEAFDAADAATRARWQAAARRVALFTSGSAALPASLATRWEALAGAIPLERYGMTEIGVGCSNPRDAAGRRRGWVGPPLPSLETRIMGEDGAPAEPGPGSLEVRGPGVFHRYHRRPEATREAFVDGWFVTGDVAERGPDGYLRLLGRQSVDILKSAGYKLSALEIEEAIREHEGVAEVAVVGLPDEALGAVVVAAVVPRKAGWGVDELGPWLEDRLARYKIPRRFAALPELPRNALGKVQKKELERILRASEPVVDE